MKIISYIKSILNPSIKSVALVLSGGGARGVIHLGVLQALDENNIKVKAISGTSMGAIIGALYCSGVSPTEIKSIMKSKKFVSIFNLSWNRRGLLAMTRLIKTISDFIPINEFESLKIPFYCCVSNLETGKYEIIKSGNLTEAVSASASIPILFEPVEINNQQYVDGGLFNNLPVEPLINNYKNILGVNVNNYKASRAKNIRSVAERVFNLVSNQSVDPNLTKCDYTINPMLDKAYNVLDFSNTNLLFDIGYNEGIKFIEKYKS